MTENRFNENTARLYHGEAGIGNYRWIICALVFFATTINYLDRAVISLLKPYLDQDFKWTETDYSDIVVAFQFSYAVGLLISGWFVDRAGTKLGYACSLILWSVAAIGHALVKSTFGFIAARSALGISEAGNFPSAIKTIAEWFPKKERALATGIFNSGAAVGAIAAPLSVPFIAEKMGWRWAFVITGAIGFVWLIFWAIIYQVPGKLKKLSKAEHDYINSDADQLNSTTKAETDKSFSWASLIRYKQTWAFILGKFLTDPVWWFYLFWLPAFLKAQYKLEGTGLAFPVALVYILSTVGSVFGGWLPLKFIKQGWPLFRSRKTSMFIYAICALPVVFAQYLGTFNIWMSVIIIGFAAAAHQAWSANIFTTVSDMFPKETVASVTGMGGMAGAIGGMLMAKLAGLLFDYYKHLDKIETGYYIMFLICGCAYLSAWLIMHFLVPTMKRINL
ncbi:MAG TPA: MFS transporter [Puia sp.]|nr:MFS transporter [Puia sp.]